MAEKIPSTPGVSDAVKVADEIIFEPTNQHRKLKAKFWAQYKENPLIDAEHVTAASIAQVTGDNRITRWWAIPGFKEWMTNKDEWRQRIEYLFDLALSSMEDILEDPDANANAKVKVFDQLSIMAQKKPTAKSDPADSELARLTTPEQVRAWLEKKGLKVVGAGDAE